MKILLIAEETTENLSPFGITLGEKFDKNIQINKLSENTFEVNPAKPISYFISYMVLLNKNELVSKIVGISDTFKNDDYCYSSKDIYSKLENALIEKYGKTQHNFDFLHSDAIWKNSNEYKMSLIKKERTHSSYWIISKNTIVLEEQADSNGCYLKLSYEKNDLIDEIIKDKSKKDKDSL
jgi:hypothetical protein